MIQDLAHPNAVGIDIGSARHFVTVSPDRDDEPVRKFKNFTEDLEELANWLVCFGVDTVAMESTACNGYHSTRFSKCVDLP